MAPPPPPPPGPPFNTGSGISARRMSEMTQRDKEERELLFASINQSTTERKPIQFSSPQEFKEEKGRKLKEQVATAAKTKGAVSLPTDRKESVNSTNDRDVSEDPEVALSPEDLLALQRLATEENEGDGDDVGEVVVKEENGAVIHKPTIDFDGLSWPSIGTKSRLEATPEERKKRVEKLTGAVRTILECIGEDPDREGLRKTPTRYAEALMFLTHGYELNLRDIVNNAVFEEDHDELVIVRDIDIFSLCEHHLVPFTGKMHVGYIPNGRVIGLSKIARIAEMFARRLQVQERLTKQVALAMAEVLQPLGVAVVMSSAHLCIAMRGVRQTDSTTVTSCMLGRMRTTTKTREEFLNLLDRR